MGLDIWFKEDVANILMAADKASGATASALGDLAADPERLRSYREGYRAALVTVALAFGISPVTVAAIREDSGKITYLPARAGQEIEHR